MIQLPAHLEEHTVFRTLFTAYPDALIVADAQGIILMANPTAATLLGYTVKELVGLGIDALVPDAVRPRHAAYREAYSHHPQPRPMGTHMELAARRRDGSEVLVEIALSPLQSLGLPLVVAAIRSIGSYPRVKQALQRAQYAEHLAQLGRLAVDSRDPKILIEQVPRIAVEALHAEIAVIYLLEADHLSFRVAGGINPLPGEPVGGRVPNRADTPPGYVVRQGRPVNIAKPLEDAGPALPASFFEQGFTSGLWMPLSDRGRTIGTLAVRSRRENAFGDDEVRFVESLSNLLAASLQRAATEDALNHAQRLESVGQLTGGIAHDFNNLLTVIQGNLQVLDELPAVAKDPHAQQLVQAATRASRRGAELTSKLLAFSRRQVLQPQAVDLSQMLVSLADMLRRTLDQRVHIEVHLGPDCPAVLADPGQLESALLNIAINARDAMPDGGKLSFRAQIADELPEQVRRELEDAQAPADHFVSISLSDTGAGMTEEVQERAFEPFFTTKQLGRGTGLGLSTVYGFVRQSKGGVLLDSAPGLGTTLTLFIPRHHRAGSDEAEPEVDSRPIPDGLRVLLVEDDPEVRSVAETFLQGLGCRVTAAANAEQALSTLTPDLEVDLLLTDIALGSGMRGTELAKQAQARRPEMAVLLMSGFSSELLDADRDSPADWALLPKPYTREELARAISLAVSAVGGH